MKQTQQNNKTLQILGAQITNHLWPGSDVVVPCWPNKQSWEKDVYRNSHVQLLEKKPLALIFDMLFILFVFSSKLTHHCLISTLLQFLDIISTKQITHTNNISTSFYPQRCAVYCLSSQVIAGESSVNISLCYKKNWQLYRLQYVSAPAAWQLR